MVEFLQQHAGLHFTLAIVEWALFEAPTGGYIAQPRVLAKTTNIDRGSLHSILTVASLSDLRAPLR